jgi:hypothetical protein
LNGAPYRHIGGMVMADHGPLSLSAARALEAFYRAEAGHRRALGDQATSEGCMIRAAALSRAATAAEAWRRAAGWADAEAADR